LGVAEISLSRGDVLCLIYRHIVHTEKRRICYRPCRIYNLLFAVVTVF